MSVAELIAILQTYPPTHEVVTVDANGGVTAVHGAGFQPYATHEAEPREAIAIFQDLDGTLGWEADDLSDETE